MSGRLGWLALLVAAASSACATPPTRLYRVTIPTLQAAPAEVMCRSKSMGNTTCTLLLTTDYQALVRELKAACLANGQPATECQTTE